MARLKRFTRRRGDHYAIFPKMLCRDDKGDYAGPAADRLAAYENSGLTPEQVLRQQGELCLQLGKEAELLKRVEALECRIAAVKSEREYFRSRAEFYREMVGERM